MSQTLLTAPRRARFARAIANTTRAWATDYVRPNPNQFYLAYMSAQRGPTTAQLRQAHQAAVLQRFRAQQRAQLTPNVCLALPLAGRALVPTAIVRYQ